MAMPPGHRPAPRETVAFTEPLDEPFIAMPQAAGALREFWLASAGRPYPARVAAETETAEETFEAVASGLGVVPLFAGDVEIYRRPAMVFRPVSGLPKGELAVAWRSRDRRDVVRVLVNACIAVSAAGGA